MAAEQFDAVVIGSGLGGLTAAACLAHEGMRVCLIERNHSLGGSASTYKVDGLTIEAALHQTADPREPYDPKHGVLKRLGVLDEVEWVPVGPLYEVRGGPLGDRPFVLGTGFDRVRQSLVARFPGSEAGLRRILDSMEGIVETLGGMMAAREQHSLFTLARSLAGVGPLISGWHKSVGEMLDAELGDDEAAKFALAANLGYYGDDPASLWWLFYAIAQGGYIRSGGTFIKGGSSRLSIKLARVVKQAGGEVILNRAATAIETDAKGRPCAVLHRGRDGGEAERVETRMVLANCAPQAVEAMLPQEAATRFGEPYRGLRPSLSLFSIHYAVKAPAPGAVPEYYSTVVLPDWISKLSDYGTVAGMLAGEPAGRLPPYTVASYGAIDSGLNDGDTMLVTVVGLDRVSNWEGLSKEAERARRQAWTDAFTADIDRRWPGFATAVTGSHFVSARSMRDYLGTPDGAIYGFAMTPPSGQIWHGIDRSPKTAIPGLFLASSYGGGGGYSGSIGTGEQAANMASHWLAGQG